MDPRHPEQAINRMDELMTQFKETMEAMYNSGSSNELAALERKGVLITQEICLVAPRLHEALMQISRESRRNIYRERLPVATPSFEANEQYVAPNQAEVYIAEPKPRKKSTRKKKVEE